MMNPVPWLQMTNMISYQGLVRTFPRYGYIINIATLKFNAGSLEERDIIDINNGLVNLK